MLDFVTDEIYFDKSEEQAMKESGQLLKRPIEVLMSRGSVCSGKAILFASLLEQISEPYYLHYGESHIGVLVKKENFPSLNGYEIDVKGESYTWCETTTPGFTIGKTHLKINPMVTRNGILQRPSDKWTLDFDGNELEQVRE